VRNDLLLISRLQRLHSRRANVNRAQFAHRYTGAHVIPFAAPAHFAHGPGMCRSCGQPSANCHCGCRQCRTEAKELVVDLASKPRTGISTLGTVLGALHSNALTAAADNTGTDTAFVGGGCCVHISVEYALVAATSDGSVLVGVKDSEGTVMAWQRTEKAGTAYTVKESIITTNPGALVVVVVNNMIARVRWCEVFSC
jgi:hypothetical protein